MIKMIKIILFVGKVKDLRIQLKIERNKKRGQLVAPKRPQAINSIYIIANTVKKLKRRNPFLKILLPEKNPLNYKYIHYRKKVYQGR